MSGEIDFSFTQPKPYQNPLKSLFLFVLYAEEDQ